MYDLLSQGYAAFARITVLDQRPIAYDPLVGRLTGSNRVFRTNYFPLLTSGSFIARDSGGSTLTGTADYNTGVIVFDGALSAQPYADYTYTPLSTTQTTRILIDGFEQMESRWPRGWRLVDGNGDLATESSATLLVVDTSGSDPLCGSVRFSQSPLQMAVLHLCFRYAYLAVQHESAAIGDYNYSESRGSKIDKSKRPSNLAGVMDRLGKDIDEAIKQAQEQYYDGSNLGGVVSGPYTTDYLESFYWQDEARLGLGINLRSF